jgi:hypothetical protein
MLHKKTIGGSGFRQCSIGNKQTEVQECIKHKREGSAEEEFNMRGNWKKTLEHSRETIAGQQTG